MSEKTYFLLPVGRLVQGHPQEMQDTDMENNPLIIKRNGVPEPAKKVYMGLAVEKQHPRIPEVFGVLQGVANTALGGQVPAHYKYKIADGDAPEHVEKPGWKGCWIFKLSVIFPATQTNPVKVTKEAGNMVMGEGELNRGDYVEVYVSTKHNGRASNDQNCGLYLNPEQVNFCGFGERISNGPNSAEVFANRDTYTPAGMSTTPLAQMQQPAPNPMGQPGAPTQQMGQPAPGASPNPMGQPQMQQPAPGAAPNPMGQPGAPTQQMGQPQMQQPAPGGQVPGGIPQQPQMQQPMGQPQMQQPAPGGMPQPGAAPNPMGQPGAPAQQMGIQPLV